jgi:TatD DNase family protein
VASYIADLKGVSIDAIAEHTTKNFFECFQVNRELT